MKISECAALLMTSQADHAKLLAATGEVTALTANTAQVTPGCTFVAIHGARFDGHDHVQEVIDAGAQFVIVERPVQATGALIVQVPDTHKALAQMSVRFFGDASRQLKVYGVTGTNGKTTTTHLIAAIMATQHASTGIIGTMYAKIGGQEYPATNTTPDAFDTQKDLAAMVAAGDSAVAMEVSSIALAQGRSWGVDFDTVVFTNLTEDHLDYHKTFEAYFDAKALLFEQLGNTYHADGKPKTAVINIDDPYGARLVESTAANVITYGTQGQGSLDAEDVRITSRGTAFTLNAFGARYPVTLRLMGDFNVYNALAALGVAYAQGVPMQDAIDALEKVPGVRGRFQVVPNPADVTVVVDYAHTPDGLDNVLDTINAFAKQRVFCVVGCGGDRETTKRPIMAHIALDKSTDPVFTADNPRTEDPEAILDEMVADIDATLYHRDSDRRAAINYALSQAKAGDVVLIAGKGHEDYQIIGHTKHHFDDVEVVEDFYARK
ncbi:UDP-N-acetylmuramoyl-L-alanyl-D-glutamate--2,6-diaminopimelate ligase [Lacticaseibacillus absianus]|uniref:UDP-N-acetylmuramoyl-L-alanyl-D-glutamate--2, 6-diaminopimelate ligase n=1 Tax=Lacticaseibacillus absianus TaxID=2729623 RepID=UPI0015CED3D3|nr:UDP-N-acetylmuramoyl-L-alanyl-D-glutamate--2,6-diaminopimelate ligase [Lacticaseibacillus absianus]